MSQVLEVRFAHPETNEEMHRAFTRVTAPYHASDHTPRHRAAIELGLSDWLSSSATLQGMERERGPESAGRGATKAWGYSYLCILAGVDGVDRAVRAILFEKYNEKGEEHQEEDDATH